MAGNIDCPGILCLSSFSNRTTGSKNVFRLSVLVVNYANNNHRYRITKSINELKISKLLFSIIKSENFSIPYGPSRIIVNIRFFSRLTIIVLKLLLPSQVRLRFIRFESLNALQGHRKVEFIWNGKFTIKLNGVYKQNQYTVYIHKSLWGPYTAGN